MRHNFTPATKRAAKKRADGRCEASGVVYGLEPGQRCNAPLAGKRVEIDHYPIPATDEGSDVLENAVTCCVQCHAHKTASYDIPMQAKGKRVSDRHEGLHRPSQWSTRPLGTGNKQHRATRELSPKFEGDILSLRTRKETV
jgi:5-methylcytosine-specific restriction protein A